MAKLERVYGDVDYYDGVVTAGIANFHGSPHAFQVDTDIYAEFPVYRLAPIVDLAAFLGEPFPGVTNECELRVRGRFVFREEGQRGDDGPWALDVEWIEK